MTLRKELKRVTEKNLGYRKGPIFPFLCICLNDVIILLFLNSLSINMTLRKGLKQAL